MSSRRIDALRAARSVAGGTPFFMPLLSASILMGFRESMSLPYMTLFAVERAHMPPLALGTFVTLRAGGAILISMIFGAWFDRRPSAWPLLLSLVAGIVGFALLTLTTNFTLLCLIGFLPLGMSAAAFPLVFATAKAVAADANRVAAERSITLLRASFSAAWGIGPAIGALVVEAGGFHALFWVSSCFSLLAMIPALPIRPKPLARGTAVPVRTRRWDPAVAFAAGALILFWVAICMAGIALPIVITAHFTGTKADVGYAACLCALLEVPVMMAIAIRPKWLMGFRGMLIGLAASVLFFVAGAMAPSVPALIWAQIPRAIGIGLVSCLGISYLQDLMPGRVGAASVLYANTSQIGQLLAGLAAGGWAQAYSYPSLFWPCALTSLASIVCLTIGKRAKPGVA